MNLVDGLRAIPYAFTPLPPLPTGTQDFTIMNLARCAMNLLTPLCGTATQPPRFDPNQQA
jgi:hypothetical protein